MEHANVPVRDQLGPEHAGEIFRRRDLCPEIWHVKIQIFVVELFDHTKQDPLEVKEIDDHTGLWINLAGDGDFQQVVVPVGRRVIAGPEDGAILGLIPFRLDVPVSRSKFDTLR